jgi:hypothetical protein
MYCSTQCEIIEKTPDIDGSCGHTGCKGKGRKELVQQLVNEPQIKNQECSSSTAIVLICADDLHLGGPSQGREPTNWQRVAVSEFKTSKEIGKC